jgi:hypothetical protein
MIEVRPYDDLTAMAVLQRLDAHDHMEAELVRGAPASHLALFADWRAMQAFRLASFVAITGPDRGARPFAVFALAHTGQAGVASAALLARDHAAFRRPLAEMALRIRTELPATCAASGIRRIEARSWAGHPTAAGLLTALGFEHETDMPGFGLSGTITFRQFAWLAPENRS